MVFIELIYNLGVLVALSVVSGFISEQYKRRRLLPTLQGLLFGFSAIIGMLNPLVLAPGLIFDGRSVMISLAGLFFGPLAAAVAGSMAVVLRFYQGGDGALTGVLVITASAVIGTLYHYKFRQKTDLSVLNLWIFGLIVHFVMLLLMLTLPEGKGIMVLQKITIPVIISYPLATIMIGKILSELNKRLTLNEKMLESETQFKKLVRDMSVGVLLQGAKAEILLNNPKALELLGLTEDQLLGKTSFDPYWNVIHEDGSEFPGITHPVPQAIATKKAVRNVVMGVYRPLKNDRVWLLVDAEPQLNNDGSVQQVVCSFINITKRKLFEQALKESEERFKALHNASFGGIAIHDKGKILECNLGLSEMFGYSIEELISMDGMLLVAPDWRDLVMKNILAGYEKPYYADGLRKNGETFPMRLEARNIPYKGKNVRNVEFRDITEQRQIETAIVQAKEKAEAANLAKSIFLANMSHEIKTPLNAILGFSNILKNQESLPAEHRKKAEIINKSGQHLLNMIIDILSMAKIEAGRVKFEKTSFDLQNMLTEVIDMMQNWSQEKGVDLILDYSKTVPSAIVTDVLKLKQVLINLLNNAIKFTENGKIVLRLNTLPHADTGKLILEFRVEDTGIGISQENLERIFEPFVQVEDLNYQKGTGLGLPICKKYIELMGGKITVESELGKGSLFKIVVPVEINELESNIIQARTITNDSEINKNKILLSRELLNNLSKESKSELQEALISLDTDLINNVIANIGEQNPDLAKIFKEYAEQYKFAAILKMLR